jgi:hypothetical protein
MPIDHDPQPSCTNPQRPIVPPKPRVSSAAWDPQRMLMLAKTGGYPSAGAEEIAHWRMRCAEVEGQDDPETA